MFSRVNLYVVIRFQICIFDILNTANHQTKPYSFQL